MRNENSPHSPQAKASVQKFSFVNGLAKKPMASFARITGRSSAALASVPVWKSSAKGTWKPTVAAKKIFMRKA